MQEIGVGSKPKIAARGSREYTLIADVVHREHRARAFEQPVPAVHVSEKEWAERGVPVVAMKNIRAESQTLTALESRAGQGEKAQVFVSIGGVNTGASVQLRAIYEVYRRM